MILGFLSNVCITVFLHTFIQISLACCSNLWLSARIVHLCAAVLGLSYYIGMRIFWLDSHHRPCGMLPKVFQNAGDTFSSIMQNVCAHPSTFPVRPRGIYILTLKNGRWIILWTLYLKKPILVWVPLYSSFKAIWYRQWIWTHPSLMCLVNQNGKIIWYSHRLLSWLMVNSMFLHQKSFLNLFKSGTLNWAAIKDRSQVTLIGGGGMSRTARIEMEPFHQIEGYQLFYFFPCEYAQHYAHDKLLLNELPCSAAIIDSHGHIHSANTAFEHYQKGKQGTIQSYLTTPSKTQFFTQLQHTRRREMACPPFLIEWSAEEHTIQKFFAFLQPFSSYDDQVLFILMIMPAPSSVSPQENNSERMQLLGQVASGIVHDFNNLLTGMIGFCDLVLQRHRPDDPSFQDLQQIKHSAVRAARLIQNLLDFSKATPSAENVFSVQGCVQNLMPLIQRMIGPKIFLSFHHDSHSSNIYGNLDVIEQMILNLAINARDAMPTGGSLDFVLKHHISSKETLLTQGTLALGKYVRLDVKDTGAGISKAILSRIFDPFFSSKDHGTGLGLANIARTVEALKGAIHVQTVEDRGSTFSIYLPFHEGDVVHKKTKPTKHVAEESACGKRILLVEDEDPIRLFSSRVLKEKGYEVLEARDGIQAMQMMKTQTDIALIITDVMMPGIDGPALISEVHKFTPHVKALFVSGYPKESIESSLPAHLTHRYFLQKPFSLTDLVAKIQEILK